MLKDNLIGGIAQGYAPQVVIVHETVEEVGTEHHRLRNLHGSILKLVQLMMTLDDIIEECQATTFAAQRALADAGEVGIAVELQSVEHSYHADVLHPSVLHNGIEDNLSVSIHILQLMPCNVFQELTYREDGTCTEPAAHVIAANVVHQRVVGYLEDIVLQLFQ